MKEKLAIFGGPSVRNDESLAEKLKVLRLHGMSRDAWQRYSSKGNIHYDQLYLGYKYNMFDIQASLGIHQLAKIDKFWERRAEIVNRYNEAFGNIEEIEPVYKKEENGSKHAHHLYVIKVKTERLNANRDEIASALQAENIGISIHFKPVHLQSYYQQNLGTREGIFPNVEYAAQRIITLPLYPAMEARDVDAVIHAVRKVIEWYR